MFSQSLFISGSELPAFEFAKNLVLEICDQLIIPIAKQFLVPAIQGIVQNEGFRFFSNLWNCLNSFAITHSVIITLTSLVKVLVVAGIIILAGYALSKIVEKIIQNRHTIVENLRCIFQF